MKYTQHLRPPAKTASTATPAVSTAKGYPFRHGFHDLRIQRARSLKYQVSSQVLA